MHFALLVSQLPHVDDARAQYRDLLTLSQEPRHRRKLLAAIRSALAKLLH
ncbi:MAG: hypothetical protein QOI13_3714 [Paraburkholderia sp.]|nr:hypothetical protein [Paraburkholderia sp.]MEA3120987.1 hypothetical protein [Paraburkholderia sp.]